MAFDVDQLVGQDPFQLHQAEELVEAGGHHQLGRGRVPPDGHGVGHGAVDHADRRSGQAHGGAQPVDQIVQTGMLPLLARTCPHRPDDDPGRRLPDARGETAAANDHQCHHADQRQSDHDQDDTDDEAEHHPRDQGDEQRPGAGWPGRRRPRSHRRHGRPAPRRRASGRVGAPSGRSRPGPSHSAPRPAGPIPAGCARTFEPPEDGFPDRPPGFEGPRPPEDARVEPAPDFDPPEEPPRPPVEDPPTRRRLLTPRPCRSGPDCGCGCDSGCDWTIRPTPRRFHLPAHGPRFPRHHRCRPRWPGHLRHDRPSTQAVRAVLRNHSWSEQCTAAQGGVPTMAARYWPS